MNNSMDANRSECLWIARQPYKMHRVWENPFVIFIWWSHFFAVVVGCYFSSFVGFQYQCHTFRVASKFHQRISSVRVYLELCVFVCIVVHELYVGALNCCIPSSWQMCNVNINNVHKILYDSHKLCSSTLSRRHSTEQRINVRTRKSFAFHVNIFEPATSNNIFQWNGHFDGSVCLIDSNDIIFRYEKVTKKRRKRKKQKTKQIGCHLLFSSSSWSIHNVQQHSS